MTDRKTEVDVNELLHQLEELKKKKAKNVKKLKRKLGGAVLLNEQESVAVSINNESNSLEQKESVLKLQTPASRNILSELNCKTSNLNKIKITEGEQKNVFEGCEKLSIAGAEASSSLQLKNQEFDSQFKSQLASENVSRNERLSEIEATLNSESKTFNVAKLALNTENYIQEEQFRHSGKRSSSDAEKERIFDSQIGLKRVKLINSEITCLDKKKNIPESDSHEKNNSQICSHIVPKSINVNQETEVKLQNLKSKTFSNDFNTQTTAALNDQSHYSKTKEEISVKNSSSNSQPLVKTSSLKDDCIPTLGIQFLPTLSKEKKTALDSSQLVKYVSESNFGPCRLTGTKSEISSEVEIDPNVTEVADTEIDFDKKLQVNPFGDQERLDLSSKISDKTEAVKLPLQEICLASSACNNEDICSSDILSNVASFEEIRTEIPQTEVIKSESRIKDSKDSIYCDFTDDESDYSKCFDSNDLEALYQTDCEKESSDSESQKHSSSNENNNCVDSNMLVRENQTSQNKQAITNPECLVADSDVLLIPETELFDFASYNESEVDDIGQNICIANNEEQEVVSTNNEVCANDANTDSLGTEDFLKLVNYHQIPFKSDFPEESKLPDERSACFKFQCCLQSDINEAVTRIKLAYFNNSQYIFIQHITWIQVWRKEKDHDWIKIFAHQVESFQLQELCLSQSENYLVLVMLLNSEQNSHCLHFLVFEKQSKLIKLMEHMHWFENKCEEDENIFLCGLDSLKFASAQGSHSFKVYSHTFSCLDGDPRMLTIALGSSSDRLHSLCRIDKLPNALLGMSNNMLYIWHLLEARLVTSVCLQVDSFAIENCIWTILENGLIFLMVACKEEGNSAACQLLAANLATGFCEVVLSYVLQPALETKLLSEKKMITYSEPLIGMTCQKGAFIWSVKEEYCCAVLKGLNYTSIAVVPSFNDSFLIILGCNEGCVNCYELKPQQKIY